MKTYNLIRTTTRLLFATAILTIWSGCDKSEEPIIEDNDRFSAEQFVGAWDLRKGIYESIWFFPNGKCYDGNSNGTWVYDPKKSKLTTTLQSLPDVTIVEWTDINLWRGVSKYYGGQTIDASKQSNNMYVDGLWNMIELQEGYYFPISKFWDIKFPDNSIIGRCAIEVGYDTYYASFELQNPYNDNLRFTITYDELYENFTSQTFSCGGKWK